jgi:phage tail sheath protein FI
MADPWGPSAIAGVPTAVPAFIREIPGQVRGVQQVGSWADYASKFPVAGPADGSFMPDAVLGYFANGGGKPAYIADVEAGSGVVGYQAALTRLQSAGDVTMVIVPDLWRDPARAQAIASAVAEHCAAAGNRMALLHTAPSLAPADVPSWPGLSRDSKPAQYATVYYPWITARGADGQVRLVPPSGHVAGIWARVDARRGVHKAPANEVVKGADSLERELTDDERAPLNESGVNCLRTSPGRGILVWGARTLSGDDTWRYLNTRRTMNYILASIQQGTAWAAGQPDTEQLRSALRASVSSFLTDLWRQGALPGATPDEGFFVDGGQAGDTAATTITFGVALIRPAKFIISQIARPT